MPEFERKKQTAQIVAHPVLEFLRDRVRHIIVRNQGGSHHSQSRGAVLVPDPPSHQHVKMRVDCQLTTERV